MQEPQDRFLALELIKHDKTTHAPERDHNATAPEVVLAFSALQASSESHSLVNYTDAAASSRKLKASNPSAAVLYQK